jgi:hypothetical protein
MHSQEREGIVRLPFFIRGGMLLTRQAPFARMHLRPHSSGVADSLCTITRLANDRVLILEYQR